MRNAAHDLDASVRKELEVVAARHANHEHLGTTAIEFAVREEVVELFEIDADAETELAHAVDDL